MLACPSAPSFFVFAAIRFFLLSYVRLLGDVDLFLVGAPEGEEHAIVAKIYEIVMGACKDLRGDDARLLVTRSASAITLFRRRGAPIQIILNTFASVGQLLSGFDVDCACCAYVLGAGQFVCSARGRRAIE